MIELTKIQREFIHGKKFDEQWKALGLNDANLKELQTILLKNPKIGAVIQGIVIELKFSRQK